MIETSKWNHFNKFKKDWTGTNYFASSNL